MNLLDLYNNSALLKVGDAPVVWSDIDMTDNTSLEILNALDLSLRSIWLNNGWIFKNRTTTMTCVAGQYEYDVPFNGVLIQDGLLLQPVITNLTQNPPNKLILRQTPDTEMFFQTEQQGMPRYFTMFNEQLLLYPIPDKAYILTCLYEASTNWALSVTTVATAYAGANVAGQKTLTVASVEEFVVGDILSINTGTSTEETGVIQSIDTVNKTFTFVGNLTFNHSVGERATTEQQKLQYANDEPNFPSQYHDVLLYKALGRLFYYDAAKLEIYTNEYGTAMNNMLSNSYNSQTGRQVLRFSRTNW